MDETMERIKRIIKIFGLRQRSYRELEVMEKRSVESATRHNIFATACAEVMYEIREQERARIRDAGDVY